MAKADTPKKTAKPRKKDQYGRFLETARELGIDDEKSAERFERTFSKVIPPKHHSKDD
jgi:hypothetical protein